MFFPSKGENSKEKADKVLANNEIISVSKRLTTLELKELNERQRAEHAQKMYEQMRKSLRQVEERNAELEFKVTEVRLLRKTANNGCILDPRCALAQNLFKRKGGDQATRHFTVKAEFH